MTMNIEVVVVNGGRARLCRAETRFPGRKSRLEGSRPAVMGNRQSEGCHAKAMQRGGRNPHLASNRVKPSQSQSKRFPIVALGRRFQPPPRYIVVPQAKCTTRCGLPPQPIPMQPYNPQFPSNPGQSVLSYRSDRSDRFQKSAIRNSVKPTFGRSAIPDAPLLQRYSFTQIQPNKGE
jgi:hypothetical protein